MAKTFNPTIEERQGCLWITFKESIDMDNYKAIEDSVSQHIKESKLQKVVIDLSQTITLFSSGLGLLMKILRQMSEGKEATDKMREGLETMNLDKILSIYPSAEAFESEQEKDS